MVRVWGRIWVVGAVGVWDSGSEGLGVGISVMSRAQ